MKFREKCPVSNEGLENNPFGHPELVSGSSISASCKSFSGDAEPILSQAQHKVQHDILSFPDDLPHSTTTAVPFAATSIITIPP
jgi:hypothetical protein